uniref:Uncharacterized protein n=1 Tax=Cajanus cajan TaxID=3821 RepID=A0A151RKM2_CAJCA|nr:hypothetical protein KK1_035538 [Cajanus cajan]KYP43494.1 hypothetical protein KK1_035061 [Cajanus cajan]
MWRLLIDKGRLWNRVLASLYGKIHVRERDEVGKGSNWWVDLWRINKGELSTDGWFSSRCNKVVRDGTDTCFWQEAWCGPTTFCVKYERLFSIVSNKNATITNLRVIVDGDEVWNWSWRRNLFQWEGELLQQLKADIDFLHLQLGVNDHWVWSALKGGEYSVRSAYNVIVNKDIFGEFPLYNYLWSKFLPSKVSGFA